MEEVEVELCQLYFEKIVALNQSQEPSPSSPPSKDGFVARFRLSLRVDGFLRLRFVSDDFLDPHSATFSLAPSKDAKL